MPAITSRHHPLVSEFRALAQGAGPLLLLDGWHLVDEAARAGVAVETIAICERPTPEQADILRRATTAGTRVIEVSASVMNALSPVKSPTGIVASAARPQVTARSFIEPAPALILAAAGVQDPGNAGALIRSAAAAGATGVLMDAASADPWGWKALRASMGSTFRLPVARQNLLPDAIDAWRHAGVAILAAVPRGGRSMYETDLTRPTAILLGGEGPGLSADLEATADDAVTIPLARGVESLNVAVAAALLMFEARRQRS